MSLSCCVGATSPRWHRLRLLLGTLCLLMVASTGLAQSRGVVTADRAVVWRADSSAVATVVDAGVVLDSVVLELTGRSDRWYEVIIPAAFGGRGGRGLMAINQVRLAVGSALPPARALRGSTPPVRSPRQALSPRRLSLPAEPAVSVRGFVQGGPIGFTALQSFRAVTGKSYGYSFGIGAQVRFRTGLYLQTSIERFRINGQRVFVFEGEAFPLGIEHTVTTQPVLAAVGFRPSLSGFFRPYAGVGAGRYRLTEVSPFDAEGDAVDEWYRGYHVHGGVEFLARRWFTPAVDARYSVVPHALGTQGAAAALAESDLGGWQFHAKILIGR